MPRPGRPRGVHERRLARSHRALPAERLTTAPRMSTWRRSPRRCESNTRRSCTPGSFCRSMRPISRWAGTPCTGIAALAEFERLAARHIEVLNHALRNVPAERVRMHVCWGNYEGPHHHDVPMERLLPIVLKAKPQGLLFEAANPRHAHEWAVFRDAQIPDDKILIPGVLATTTNYIEHPSAGGRADRALRAHRRARAGHGRHRLRLWDLCRIRTGRAGHRLPEAAVPG